ncbi:uncharacterized protein LOC117792032 [Drosophila innubila]|uniref:uncharacterized protein LOC117792032 n=1 Tax=Drosophila innubila TaxID=198719 RepID=UPI00148C3740|nr:uncharacterized protein LOC117792032 [Drosophila innubila]
MGASNSKPQTVQMSNTSPFQISREVLERVESVTKPEKVANPALVCENCSRTATATTKAEKSSQVQQLHQQPIDVASSWARRSTEIEELQFSKTLDRVHNLFGQPVKWAKANECSADIELMEQQLITCYRQYGSEPLKCAALANTYHTFVFNKQVAAVQNTKQDGKDLKGAGTETATTAEN